MSGAIFLGIATLICVGLFLNGLRFSRMPEERARDSRVMIELPFGLGHNRSRAEQARLIGRIQMIVAPLFLLFIAALAFGLLGPVEGIETILPPAGGHA